MATELTQKSCAPCHGSVEPLRGTAIEPLLRQIPGWEAAADHHLYRHYKFPDFASALAFVNRIGEIAEKEQHHPDVCLGWGRVDVETHTHAINGLSENDFILAAKIEAAH